MRVSRLQARAFVIGFLLLPFVAAAVTDTTDGGKAEDRMYFSYWVVYDPGGAGTAKSVSYRAGDHALVELTDEPLPWMSDPVPVGVTDDLTLVAQAPPVPDAQLTCGATLYDGLLRRDETGSTSGSTCRLSTTIESLIDERVED